MADVQVLLTNQSVLLPQTLLKVSVIAPVKIFALILSDNDKVLSHENVVCEENTKIPGVELNGNEIIIVPSTLQERVGKIVFVAVCVGGDKLADLDGIEVFMSAKPLNAKFMPLFLKDANAIVLCSMVKSLRSWRLIMDGSRFDDGLLGVGKEFGFDSKELAGKFKSLFFLKRQ